ncbi:MULTISPECIES: LptF/LptG family permease [Campylobacter]|uniref:LptF/LptG family permease n=1 Tax=Campylobacter TaxID=194 RepID=UPI000A344439|nr:LptF/LptG family permease [Campylobacter sp. P0124]MCR8696251.1 LptF/LptG family permease [Campylobacter sp. RM19073]
MKLFARYSSFIYLKYFFIIFISLIGFYVVIDTLTNLKNLPSSANLQLIYVSLTALISVNYILPISLVLALIVTMINLIRSNELVSFYALGVSKNRLIMPIFTIALAISFGYIGLCFTQFAYAKERQESLEDFQSFERFTNWIFLRFENKFIYIDKLFGDKQSAKDIKIFDMNGSQILSQTIAKEGSYKDNIWILKDNTIITLPQDIKLGGSGLEIKNLDEIVALNNFRPRIIESIKNSDNLYSIGDAIDAIRTFKNENINITKIKSTLYSMIFFPLFAPFMILILYYYMPLTGRFASLAIASFISIFVSLCVWGVLFLLIRISINGAIAAEFGIILPIIILMLFAGYKVYKNR